MQYDEGCPSSQTPPPPTNPSSFLLLWSFTRVSYTLFLPLGVYIPKESHHCHITPRAVQALKGQGSLHHSAGLVCKEDVNVRGLCKEPDGSEAEHVL